MYQFSSSRYDQDAADEVKGRLDLRFSKSSTMSPRDSVSLNSLDFESQISRKI